MKIILQRVTSAQVTVENEVVGAINQGYLALVGFTHGDTTEAVDQIISKIKKLRLFPDDNGKTNLSISDINGELLIVSQFTIYADCRKGNRPSFTDAAPSSLAETLYDYFVSAAKPHFSKVASGKFGESMQVQLVNDGPFTVII